MSDRRRLTPVAHAPGSLNTKDPRALQVGLIRVPLPVMAPDQTEEDIPAGTDARLVAVSFGGGVVMSQGLRGGRMGKLFAGLGALLCASVVGCTDVDKPKFGTNTKQPGPGLPGTAPGRSTRIGRFN